MRDILAIWFGPSWLGCVNTHLWMRNINRLSFMSRATFDRPCSPPLLWCANMKNSLLKLLTSLVRCHSHFSFAYILRMCVCVVGSFIEMQKKNQNWSITIIAACKCRCSTLEHWRKLSRERPMVFINGNTLNECFCLHAWSTHRAQRIKRRRKKYNREEERKKKTTRQKCYARKHTRAPHYERMNERRRKKNSEYVGSEAKWMSNTQKPQNDKQLHLEIDPKQC